MKNFTIQLNAPPRGVYFPGMTVSGVVIVENDEEPKAYRQIQVALDGEARVSWYEIEGRTDFRGQGRHRTVEYHDKETFIHCHSVLWNKDRDAGGGLYPVGIHHYQFEFQLNAPKLPPTHTGTVGHITYLIDAKVFKEGAQKKIKKVSVPITVVNAVEITHPSLLRPYSIEESKTVCCLCCASGPIIMQVTMPRTGYCAGVDFIPFEVTIENGSSYNVRQLVATIAKEVVYLIGDRTRSSNSSIARIASQPIAPHTTFVWKPAELFQVPHTETTSESCNIVKINYSLQFTAAGSIGFAIGPKAEIPLVLGNIPLTGSDAQTTGPSLRTFNPPTQEPLFGLEEPPSGQSASSAIPLAPYPPQEVQEPLPSCTETIAKT